LNRDEVMQVWKLGNCKNFVGKREELVFNAFINSEPKADEMASLI